jgi:hypothetical protein
MDDGDRRSTGLIGTLVAWSDRVAAWGLRMLQGRVVRVLWLLGASVLAVGGLLFGTLQAASVVAHEERTETAEIDADSVTSIAVDNGAGDVTIVGVEGPDTITVRAHISEGLRATGHEIDRRDGMLFVRGSCPLFGSEWCAVDYTIEVPAGMYVDVSAVEGVTVSDQAGGLRAHSSAASVELVRVGGDVAVSANQGRIEGEALTASRIDATANQGRLTLDFAGSPEHVVAQANQGRIDIVLPDDPDVFYDTDTEANQGTVNAEVRTDPSSGRTITAQANQGSITIGYGAL